MNANGLTPIFNVSDIVESFERFEKFGRGKNWTGAIRRHLAVFARASARYLYAGTTRAV